MGLVEVSIKSGQLHYSLVQSASALSVRLGAVRTEQINSFDLAVEDDVLLGATADSDVARVTGLIRRVVEQADRMEQEHLAGFDQPLAMFKADLDREAIDGR